MWQSHDRKSRHVAWCGPEVTKKWRHCTGSHLEVAVEGRKLGFCIRLSSYRAVTHRRWQSRDRKWRIMTWGSRKWLASDVISPEVIRKWLEKAENSGFWVHLSSYRAVTRRRWQSHDRKWRHVTWHGRKWSISDVSSAEITWKRL